MLAHQCLHKCLEGCSFYTRCFWLSAPWGSSSFGRAHDFGFPNTHILAAMSLAVALGLFSVSNPPVDAPINRGGQITKFLFVLTFPAIVYFFFVFYGGQRAAFRRKEKTAGEVASLIERFLNGTSLYPQAWNDFVECGHLDRMLDSYRKRCHELDPLVKCPDPQDAKALGELRGMVDELRNHSIVR
jgi:hypothetical protein